jgi:hypothetical protein
MPVKDGGLTDIQQGGYFAWLLPKVEQAQSCCSLPHPWIGRRPLRIFDLLELVFT